MRGRKIALFLKALAVLLLLVLILILFVVGGLFWPEYSRSQLIIKYTAPRELIEKLNESEQLNSRSLLLPIENKICAMGSYGYAENLEGLNSSQLESLPKEILPSEDLTWYLIFLSEMKAERIYLIGEAGLQLIGSGCIDSGDEIFLTTRQESNGLSIKSISFKKEKNK
jgi:hypothetical protein